MFVLFPAILRATPTPAVQAYVWTNKKKEKLLDHMTNSIGVNLVRPYERHNDRKN